MCLKIIRPRLVDRQGIKVENRVVWPQKVRNEAIIQEVEHLLRGINNDNYIRPREILRDYWYWTLCTNYLRPNFTGPNLLVVYTRHLFPFTLFISLTVLYCSTWKSIPIYVGLNTELLLEITFIGFNRLF